jgi:hypothetical protein
MRILENHQDGPNASKTVELPDQRFEDLLSPPLGFGRERRITAVRRHRQQVGDQRRRFGRVLVRLRQQCLELVELDRRSVVTSKAGGPFQLCGKRMQWTVAVMRRTEIAEPGMRLAVQALLQGGNDARLADARLAGKQDGLALAVFRPRPTAQQRFDLLLATDQGAEHGGAQRLETTLHRARPKRLPDLHRRANAPDRDGADVAIIEEIAEQTPRLARDQHASGLGQALPSGGEVRRFTDDTTFLHFPAADQIADDDKAGSDADAAGEFADRSQPQRANRTDQLEPGQDRPLGIVLLRPRVAEIDQYAVAHVFGDEAVEPADRVGDAVVIGGDDLAQILGIELRGQRRRTNQVAEHHRELAALGAELPGRRRHRAGNRIRWRAGPQRGDGLEQLAPVTDRADAECDQIVGG